MSLSTVIPVCLSTKHSFLPTAASSLSDPSTGIIAPTGSDSLMDLYNIRKLYTISHVYMLFETDAR